jgi:glycine cleavage system aminomethyltransferase T
VVCTRITYVGELGFELFVPTEQAVHVHDCLVAASKQVDLRLTHAGLKALGSLRMEKGYRDYGHDIDNTDSILEAGLGFTCDYTKKDGFVGMDVVLKQKELGVKGLPQRLLQVKLLNPEELLFHGEVVYCDGKIVGDIRTASYGHSLGGSVGLAMVSFVLL